VEVAGIILYLGVFFYIFTFIYKYAAVLISVVLSIILNFVLSVTNILGNLKYGTVNLEKPTISQLLLYFVFIFFLTKIKVRNRITIAGLILILNTIYLLFP
jgi:competence protein ComEC